jgi:Fe-Mn family superoxide dismutase
MMTRRQAIKTTALATTALAIAPTVIGQNNPVAATAAAFTLPPLPYALDALEPHIDARTMEIHHGKHHKAYVDNLNKALAEHPTLASKSIEDLLKDLNTAVVPEKIRATVRNNGGGHYNHSLFWQMMSKSGGGEPKAELARAIEKSFGNFADFKIKFSESATKVFGSGWAWLVLESSELKIVSMPNQNSPISPDVLASEVHDSLGKKLTFIHPSQQPLLGLDVWEHAYYLKYQNKRADYIAAWWNVVNWDFVAERYAKLKG